MESVLYAEAAALLGITENAVRHAASRGVLTRLPRNGYHVRLIKEQVQLFKGKRLSMASLTAKDSQLWREYAQMGQVGINTPESDIRAIVQHEVSQQEKQLAEMFGDFLLQMGLQFKETIRPQLKELIQNREVPEGRPFQTIH